MKKNFILIVITIFLVSFSGLRKVQEPAFLKKLKQELRSYNSDYHEEKVYLQLDKPFYKPGEDIWFSAFVLNSNTHEPTHTSDVVYVELIDPKGSVLSKLDLVIKEGTAHGDFQLADDIAGGLFKIRAYTKWMKNFGDESFFKKDVQIQRVVTPRLLLNLDYEKESYGPGELVNASLTIKNLKNEHISNADVNFSVRIVGEEIFKSKIVSDANGEVNINFNLPLKLETADGLLHIVVASRGVAESISRSIPIVLNKITLNFFPEGGNWVDNVNTNIARSRKSYTP